ncbi:MAG: phosphoribosylaminoimidazolesuccinocarboxamide synthase [Deltaproteobacteria bacterium]|nr:phosphoribosylaminoimidazolesuccinocarboxamide synthase [Deltaproteobacteria bacterium]
MPHALADAAPLGKALGLSGFYQGKVRDNWSRGDQRILVVSDRISAFDRLLGVIPFKGEMLTQIARFWFEKTAKQVPNHLLSVPDPQVMIAKEAKAIPLELIVRARLTGSLWREYESGKHQAGGEAAYGITLPKGMTQYQAFAQPIITPSTKAAYGEHDTPISAKEIVARGICTPAEWERVQALALTLFDAGSAHAKARGLVLVDTKYEFGRHGGEIIAIDEVHTPDCSRYWYADDLDARIKAKETPRMLDKEFLRGWLIEHGWKGDGPPPEIPDSVRAELARRYLELYEVLVGSPLEVHSGPVLARVEQNLRKALA